MAPEITIERRWRGVRCGATRSDRGYRCYGTRNYDQTPAIRDEGIKALAEGLLTAMSLIDPAAIVLGGGLSGAGARLIEPLAIAVKAESRPFHTDIPLRLASLGDWSGCAGAAVAAVADESP
jgi:predicted NBD/HSP70 family sugar kinase